MKKSGLIRNTLMSAILATGITLGDAIASNNQKEEKETSQEQYWHGSNEGITFSPTGVNLAFTEESEYVHPDLTEFSRKMDQGIFQINENVYLAYGYALTSPVMVVGVDGVIIVDPPEDVYLAEQIKAEFDKITDLPIKAVIYSHWHIDHYGGVKGFVSQEQVDNGEVEIIAHDTFMHYLMASSSGGTGPIIEARVDYSLGSLLEAEEKGRINGGLGPVFEAEKISLIAPTLTLKDELKINIAGVEMEIYHAPSEAPDEIVVWFPELEVLHVAEVIQGESFPNLHTVRGTRYRDPDTWFKTIDRVLRPLPAKFMVSSHGRPVSGYEEVADVLTSYRDAIQYVYDQSIRYINQGLQPDDLAELVQLPEELANHAWLGDFYGGVAHSARQVYYGELGWFNGDPTFLDPIHPRESSERYIKLMGGRNQVMEEAKKAYEEGDFQWASELTTHVIRIDKGDQEARLLKADALRELGYAKTNINWRNWYLTAAQELDGTIDYSKRLNILAPDLMAAFPSKNLVENFRYKIDPEKAKGVNTLIGFEFTDQGEAYTLEIRNGIVEIHDGIVGESTVVIQLSRSFMNDVFVGNIELSTPDIDVEVSQAELLMAWGLHGGEIVIKNGTVEDVKEFFNYFDEDNSDPITLTDR